MKTVKQQAEVLFQSLDFADKVMMLPIMDVLVSPIKRDICLNIKK